MATQVIERPAETKEQESRHIIEEGCEFHIMDLESLVVGDSPEIEADLSLVIDDFRPFGGSPVYLLRRVFSAVANLPLKADDWLGGPPQTHRDRQNAEIARANSDWTNYW